MNFRSEKDYFSLYEAQLPVIGIDGQERLRHAQLHVSGTGRIGTFVIAALACSGVTRISANDPQELELENIGCLIVAGRSDLGKPKVLLLQACLQDRAGFVFQPVIAASESTSVEPFMKSADLIVSCANTLEGRLAAERHAITYHKPILQVAAFDGRQRLGGLITVRLPGNRHSACFGCYVGDGFQFYRGEGLMSTVTATLAGMASNMAVQILTGVRSDWLREHNRLEIDLENYQIERMRV
ncbi:MAG: ThiF family adenylyltransferase, partial [Acidobacteria bacterium]|nr:ThiF family adenylyltransferase [Acidobacteriota bacterium]